VLAALFLAAALPTPTAAATPGPTRTPSHLHGGFGRAEPQTTPALRTENGVTTWAPRELAVSPELQKKLDEPTTLVGMAELNREQNAMPTPAGTPPRRSGKRVTLVEKDADLRDVVERLAKELAKNVVIGAGVKGKVSIDVHDAAVEDALTSLLKPRGLEYRLAGNVVLIGPAPRLR